MSRLLLWLILVLYNFSAQSQTRVCASCDFKNIQRAIDASNPHDTVILEGGTYLESGLKINKPLTLEGRNRPVIDGQDKGYILEVFSDSVYIKGITFRNVGISHTKDYSALHLYRVNHFRIENNRFEKVFFGIMLEKSKRGEVIDNFVEGTFDKEFYSGNGIHSWHCSNLTIKGNELSGLRDGIYLEFTDDSEIANNLSYKNVRYGLHFMFSNRDNYRNNEFHHNGAGVAVMFSKNIEMTGNIFSSNWGAASYGLLLKEIYDAKIEHNDFTENTIGINVDGSTRIDYINNNFLRNGWAVKVTGGCYMNTFIGNNFMSNSFDISYNSKINDNSFHGNYWSAYTGYDINADGRGDIPFRPVKLFSYIVNRTPESIVLLRSLFIDIINFSEKVTPIFTPDNLMDDSPLMKRVIW